MAKPNAPSNLTSNADPGGIAKAEAKLNKQAAKKSAQITRSAKAEAKTIKTGGN